MITENTDIRYIKGVGERRAELFSKLGITSVGALLHHYPRNFENFDDITQICDAVPGNTYCFKAKVLSEIKEYKVRSNMVLYRFLIGDKTDSIGVIVFNNRFIKNTVKYGQEYLFYGKISQNGMFKELSAPKIKDVSFIGQIPVYNATEGLSCTTIEKTVRTVINDVEIKEILPYSVLKSQNLCGAEFAIKNIHFPKDKESYTKAKKRLVFEELFILQLGLKLIKSGKKKPTESVIKKDFFGEFASLLPFEMTNAQVRVIKDCISDMMSDKSMNRLVQGDVGSGKTAVAAAVMFTAAKNGLQSAIMAPTEVLAVQHFKSFEELFKNTGIRCCLLTGSVTKKNKSLFKANIKAGNYDIVVGTHAIITEDVEFKNLGLVITDEQHRFGVNQRLKLSLKGKNPHTLVMSATPIPRTLAMVLYGDLDISIIDEYPKNRKEIKSYAVTPEYNERIYTFLKKEIASGRQCYIVCPSVEENDSGIESAEECYKRLSANEFKDFSVGLIHGKMKPKDKDSVMNSFKNGDIDLLISTTVIEVGIDVPNATVMVIENAEQFGLSQLHQLRGRIGRGEYPSTCIFVSPIGKTKRISVLVKSNNGFLIADEDLKLRGPGDFLGSKQHGLPEFKIADLCDDLDVFRVAGSVADSILKNDPKLSLSEHSLLKDKVDGVLSQVLHN